MGLNDNQWGKRGGGSSGGGGGGGNNQGPPDLDELWRRFNRKLNDMLGNRKPGPREVGSGGGGGFGGGGFTTGQWRNGGLLIAVVVVLIWLSSGIYIVAPAERGVVLRFGKFVEETNPGPRWHLPWPIERAEVVNVSGVRTVEIGYRNNPRNKVLRESLMLTDDENIVDVQFAVQYTLSSGRDFLLNVRNPDESVLQAAETAIRQVVGIRRMDAVLYEDRGGVQADVLKVMQSLLDRYNLGILISNVTMQSAQPPEQVQAAFDDAVRAGQDRERQKNEGEAYANDVIPRARGAASRLAEEAEGYRQRVVATAEGEATRFRLVVEEYNRAPRVTRDRLYIDAMNTVMTNATKVVVDQRQGSNLLFLPLDKLIAATGGSGQAVNPGDPVAAASPASKPAPVEPAAASPETARSREAFRSREREQRQ
ncbi:MAG: FtsH protease activity modulator HflK [bacterium]|jgi:membrane protease subunit HflK|nr:FtsH protease activity modulator HflK [Betaproteobacteria bacterium]